MNRRKALFGLAFLSGSALAGITGFKWLQWHKEPDLAYLSSQKKLLEALTETIIPTTDTPGAIEAGVADFILRMVAENMTPVAQNRFIEGLKVVDSYAIDACKKPYTQCNPKQQQAIMQQVEEQGRPLSGFAGKVQKKLVGSSFFTVLKEYTCMGYCTSLVGATRGLAYAYVPGRFTGCMPLANGQKSWATK